TLVYRGGERCYPGCARTVGVPWLVRASDGVDRAAGCRAWLAANRPVRPASCARVVIGAAAADIGRCCLFQGSDTAIQLRAAVDRAAGRIAPDAVAACAVGRSRPRLVAHGGCGRADPRPYPRDTRPHTIPEYAGSLRAVSAGA